VLAVPRLAKYGEHIDDHQTQLVEALEKEGYIKAAWCIDDLLDGINSLENTRSGAIISLPWSWK